MNRLNQKIAQANADIAATKLEARELLVLAETKLAQCIANRDAAAIEFYRIHGAIIKAQSSVCEQLRNLAE